MGRGCGTSHEAAAKHRLAHDRDAVSYRRSIYPCLDAAVAAGPLRAVCAVPRVHRPEKVTQVKCMEARKGLAWRFSNNTTEVTSTSAV